MQHCLVNVQINVNICFKYIFHKYDRRDMHHSEVFLQINIKVYIFFICVFYISDQRFSYENFCIVKYLRTVHYLLSGTCAPRDKETFLKVAQCTVFCILANILTIFDSKLSLATGQVIDPC